MQRRKDVNQHASRPAQFIMNARKFFLRRAQLSMRCKVGVLFSLFSTPQPIKQFFSGYAFRMIKANMNIQL